MYASYNYYESGYLLGRDPKLSEDDFPFWEKQAERVLNQYTFSRLVSNFGLITDEVKDCTCELAELLYQADKSAQQAAEQGGVLQSYSNDGESGTFDVSQSTFTEEGKAKKTREIVYRYLGNTGLLYAGGVSMNQNYIHTITLYNRIQAADSEDRKEHWKRTVLHNCFWKAQVNTSFNGTQASVQNTYVVRIPEDDRYLPYAEYKDSPEEHFTASQGDIVIYGECLDEITGVSGQTAAQVLNRHKPNAFKVTAFSDNTSFPWQSITEWEADTMKVKFEWNDPPDRIAKKKLGGQPGMLFLATTAARFMDPYVPADNLVLAQNVDITADEGAGYITYNSPYAHYQYMGELYGPNIPIFDGEELMGFWSPPHKNPTGRKLKYNTFRHPLATDHWDHAMMTARKEELAKSYEEYLKLGGRV